MGLFYFSLFVVFIGVVTILFFVFRGLYRMSGLKAYQAILVLLFGGIFGRLCYLARTQ